MSRVGKKPIEIPSGVEVKINGEWIEVKGAKGALKERVHPAVKAEVADNQVTFTSTGSDKASRAAFGLMRALTANMVTGVSQGFQKTLEIVGVGYRAQPRGDSAIELQLGFSHPVTVEAPEGVTFEVPSQTQISVIGIDTGPGSK